jgi:hypothetical protein
MPFFPKLPTITDFMTIANLHLKFSSINKLPDGRKIADGFASLYAGVILNYVRIFVDEVAQDTVKADTDLNAILRKIIVEEMIAPFAHQTGVDAVDVIRPLIRNAGLCIGVKDSGTFLKHCITKAAMTKALIHARDSNSLDQVEISLGVNHLFFDTRSEITFLDFKLIGTTCFPAPAAPPGPPTAADIATAVATAVDLVHYLSRLHELQLHVQCSSISLRQSSHSHIVKSTPMLFSIEERASISRFIIISQ